MAFGEGQEMTLTFNTHIPSLTQLVVDASTKFRWKNDPAKVKTNIYSAEKVVRPKQCSAKKWSGHGWTGRTADDGLYAVHEQHFIFKLSNKIHCDNILFQVFTCIPKESALVWLQSSYYLTHRRVTVIYVLSQDETHT